MASKKKIWHPEYTKEEEEKDRIKVKKNLDKFIRKNPKWKDLKMSEN